ncbi:hypothetical protein X566_22525 [Afipia sp. P52-10]|uniref:hypothetical protein n=1 Tax=Afipia sp. P52-10 TaxID=1429916 RepID=UPI0003DF3FF2|nr:hypothetical protein [Afipia sp. P52-10]ETR75960.1 hypothetical protein X566_22525 [Afipia sp. P52-10]
MALTHPAFVHHRIDCAPRAWSAVAQDIIALKPWLAREGGILYGVWRSQIGEPRDTLNIITSWSLPASGVGISEKLNAISQIRGYEMTSMEPTLRPASDAPPVRQGNFAFRWQETPAERWQEFLDLCVAAWPGFEGAYDSQVVGLWKLRDSSTPTVRSLLLTRRPNLAMWERSKIPQGAAEAAVRDKLNQRYDLCTSTVVYTTTLLTADDRADTERWT